MDPRNHWWLVEMASRPGGFIANALRQLGASPITQRTFVLPSADKCSIADLQRVLGELFSGGDQMLVVGDSAQGFAVTALICANTNERVSVRKSPLGQENDNGDPCSRYDPLSNSGVARASIKNT